VVSAGLRAEFSRCACFLAPTGQWGNAKGRQSQLIGKREPWGLVSWHLSKIGGCCGSAQAAGEGCGQRRVGGGILPLGVFPVSPGQLPVGQCRRKAVSEVIEEMAMGVSLGAIEHGGLRLRAAHCGGPISFQGKSIYG